MHDQARTREQLMAENEELRRRLADYERSRSSSGDGNGLGDSPDPCGDSLVADRKQAEAKLRDSEERFRRIFEEGPLGVVLARPDGSVQHVNRRFCETLRYAEQEIIALGIQGITHPDDRERQRSLGSRLHHDEIPFYTIEKRYLRKDGQVIWGQLTASMMHDAENRPTHIIGMIEDITARKQSEEALLESERRLSTLMSNLPGMAYRCRNDRDWSMEFVSEGCSQLTGYQVSEVVDNRTVSYGGMIHPNDREAVWEQVQQALAERRRFQFEYRIRTAQGEERWVWEQGVGVFSGSGELQSLEGFITDITDRQRAQEELRKAHDELEQRVEERTAALRESNARLQAEVQQRGKAEEQLAVFGRFVEAATQGFGMSDLDGRITYVNPMLARMLGEDKPEDACGKDVATYHSSEYASIRNETIRPAVSRNGYWQGELPLVRRDGTVIPILHNIFPVRDKDENVHHFALVATDITELKQAQQALRESYEELRTIHECMIDGILIADIETRSFAKVNRAISQMLGYPPEQLISMSIMDIHPQDSWPTVMAKFQSLVAGQALRADSVPLMRRDGSVFYADITANQIVYHGRVCMIGFFRDVSERKQAEEKLKREHEALRRMVIAGDHERRLITYELHDGVAQQLLGAMFHFQASGLSKGRNSKTTEADFRDGMNALRQAALEIRRVMNGLRTPVLDMYGLAEAIEDVAAQLRLIPEAPEIEYRHDVNFKRLEPTLENSLFRIAQESITNACRHSKSRKVGVTLVQQGDEVTLEVRDWGTGFDPETIQENHFGLEGIRERARLLDGKLSIESQPGQGTVVWVTLPVVEARHEE